MILAVLALALFAPFQDAAPTERQLRNEFKKGFAKRDARTRADAVNDYGFATRDLPEDEAASKIVARTLKTALRDDDPQVLSAAITAMAWGRHVDTVLEGMEDVLDDQRNVAEKYATRTGDADKLVYDEAIRLFGRACDVVAWHPDDRAVDILIDQLRNIEPNAPADKLPADLLEELAPPLLRLGSHEAVEIMVRWAGVFGGEVLSDNTDTGRNFSLAARRIHDALAHHAADIGHRGPAWSDRYDVAWAEWFDEVEKELEKKLGKLEEPTGLIPEEDEEDEEDMLGDERPRP